MKSFGLMTATWSSWYRSHPPCCPLFLINGHQVDGIYFNVHRAMLAQSCGLIKDMLALPAEDKTRQSDGSSVEHPVPIHDVAFHDFEVVLRDAYGRYDSYAARYRLTAGVNIDTDSRSLTLPPMPKTWSASPAQPIDCRHGQFSLPQQPKL